MAIRIRPLAGLVIVAHCFSCSSASADVDAGGYYNMRCASCHGANGEGTEASRRRSARHCAAMLW